MVARVTTTAASGVPERQSAAAVLTTDALQRAIFNSANFSSIATDASGIIQIFNVGAERMLGYSAIEVVNKITPADISDSLELITRANALSLEQGAAITPGFEAMVFKASRGIEDIYELTYIRQDGRRVPAVVSVTALRDPEGAIIGYLLIGTDNTARKQIEEERTRLDQQLRDQSFYTRSLIDSNVDALMMTDLHGIVTDANKQAEALTGLTRDELIGGPFKDYFTDPRRAQAAIVRVLDDRQATTFELMARARDGTLAFVSCNATTFYDRDRTLQGVFACVRDVTELKRVERALQLKNAELEDASRMKSAFLANMSHELRTPLNAVIGFSEVLRDGLLGDMTEKQRGFLGDIFDSGKHLLSLINDILDLSKVEAGKMELNLESMHASALFANSLSIVREDAATRRIALTMDAEDLGFIRIDARKVKQIIYNLLSNAVKFASERGKVNLRVRRVPRADVGRLVGPWARRMIRLPTSEFTEFLEIGVTDTGIGIAPEDLEQLFTPFNQIDSGLSRKFHGTGLGLAMVRLITELHGGTVAVESALGEGSRFTVWLPFRDPVEPGTARSETPETAGERDAVARTALVLDDDHKSAELVRLQLESEGFRVLHAASAEAALILAARQPLSLITLDIMLPNMDGWEFLSRVQQDPTLRRIPVVIISIVADRTKGMALGAAAVLEKPMSRRDLYEALDDLALLHGSAGRKPTVLVVDDDRTAVDLVAIHMDGLASTVLRAYTGRDAIEIARQALPDVIVLDLVMPEMSGFDVVASLQAYPETAHIPVVVVSGKVVTSEERAKLAGSVATILEKADFNRARFTAEVRRAMSGRWKVV